MLASIRKTLADRTIRLLTDSWFTNKTLMLRCQPSPFARASRNFLEIGNQIASELLSRLYNDLLLLDGKRQSLKAVLHGSEGIFSKLAEYKAVQAELSAKKPELKQQFRAGLLDQKQYQQSLKRLRDQDFQQSMLAWELVTQFIDQHLPRLAVQSGS